LDRNLKVYDDKKILKHLTVAIYHDNCGSTACKKIEGNNGIVDYQPHKKQDLIYFVVEGWGKGEYKYFYNMKKEVTFWISLGTSRKVKHVWIDSKSINDVTQALELDQKKTWTYWLIVDGKVGKECSNGTELFAQKDVFVKENVKKRKANQISQINDDDELSYEYYDEIRGKRVKFGEKERVDEGKFLFVFLFVEFLQRRR